MHAIVVSHALVALHPVCRGHRLLEEEGGRTAADGQRATATRRGGRRNFAGAGTDGFAEAVAAARQADLVVAVLGGAPVVGGGSAPRAPIGPPRQQQKALAGPGPAAEPGAHPPGDCRPL